MVVKAIANTAGPIRSQSYVMQSPLINQELPILLKLQKRATKEIAVLTVLRGKISIEDVPKRNST